MTSGPAMIPINSFEGVLHHGLQVVSTGGHYARILANAKSAAEIEVYNNHFETFDTTKESLTAVLADPKKLMYTGHATSSGAQFNEHCKNAPKPVLNDIWNFETCLNL